MDILTISSKLFKGVIRRMAIRAIKNSLGINIDLELENLTVRHAEGEKVEFAVNINGNITETEFKSLVEKALN